MCTHPTGGFRPPVPPPSLPPPRDCSTHRCGPDEHCVMTPINCFRAPCPPGIPSCQPNMTPPTEPQVDPSAASCATRSCPPGTACEVIHAPCAPPPPCFDEPCPAYDCPSAAVCRPVNPPPFLPPPPPPAGYAPIGVIADIYTMSDRDCCRKRHEMSQILLYKSRAYARFRSFNLLDVYDYCPRPAIFDR